MCLCAPGLLLTIIALHVYALVVCNDAKARGAIVQAAVSLALMIVSFAIPLLGPSDTRGLGWVGASMLLFAIAATAVAGDGARRTSALADRARGELDRGASLRRAANAMLALACTNLLFVTVGGLVLALTLTSDFP